MAPAPLVRAHAQELPQESAPARAHESTLRAGFDGDARDDLAAGAPGAVIAGQTPGGAVVIRYSRPGLPAQRITQDTRGVPGAVEAFDNFGSDVTSADLNGDGYDDLAVGLWNEYAGGGTGAVIFIPGSLNGLVLTRSPWWSQATAGVPGSPETVAPSAPTSC